LDTTSPSSGVELFLIIDATMVTVLLYIDSVFTQNILKKNIELSIRELPGLVMLFLRNCCQIQM